MTRTFNARATACWAAALLFLCASATASADIDRTEKAAANGRVVVSNPSGEITVTGADTREVRVTGQLGDGAELELDARGDHTTISVVKSAHARRMESTVLEIQIPQGSELNVNGVATDIEVRNVYGVQRLETVSGDLAADVFERDIEAKSVNGDVRIDGHGAKCLVRVTSVSGDTEIHNVAGEVESSAVSGDIKVRGGEFNRVRLQATSSDIDVSANLAAAGWLEAETISGDVEIGLGNAADLNVDIETFNGDIDNCFDVEGERKSEYGPGRFLRFSRGEADRYVRVKTMNGDVEICADGG